MIIFLKFLESLKNSTNESLIESVKSGYQTITTGKPIQSKVKWKVPELDEEIGEIERTAEDFSIDIGVLTDAYKDAIMISLDDDIWSKMDNTDSYHEIKKGDLDLVRSLSKEYERDPERILDAYKKQETLPAPMVLKHGENEYYLIGGNTRLLVARALGDRPQILLLDITN